MKQEILKAVIAKCKRIGIETLADLEEAIKDKEIKEWLSE